MQEKFYKCNHCGKEFDEILPTMISYIESPDDPVPITKEVCPYCFSDDVNVKLPKSMFNPFIFAVTRGIDVEKMIKDVIDDYVARGELVLSDNDEEELE